MLGQDTGEIRVEDLKYAFFEKSELDDLALTSGDILLIRSNGSIGLVGKVAVVTQPGIGMAFAGYLIRLRLLQSVIAPRYLALVFSSRFLRNQIEGNAKSTSGVNNINSDEVRNLVIPLPPISEQIVITNLIEKSSAQLRSIDVNIRDLSRVTADLSSSILSNAFSGRLVPQDVSEGTGHELLASLESHVTSNNAIRPTIKKHRLSKIGIK